MMRECMESRENPFLGATETDQLNTNTQTLKDARIALSVKSRRR
jgi:hypothetical protein